MKFRLVFIFLFFLQNIYAINTNLKDKGHIQTFSEVTSKIRCICIPSIPIKSCSFNNCTASAILKEFIESRIKKGEKTEKIVDNIVNGYGRDIINDPFVQNLIQKGNTGIISGLINGFGTNLLAEPDPTWINLTVIFILVLGFGFIVIYLNNTKNKNQKKNSSLTVNKTQSIYLEELAQKQK